MKPIEHPVTGIYRIGSIFLWLVFLLVLPAVYMISRKRRATLLARSGLCVRWRPRVRGRRRLWVHALSVGEVKSALPLVKALKNEKELEIVFTASTRTGYEMARQFFGAGGSVPVDQLGYFPYDFLYSVEKAARMIDPDAVVMVETDLWPNFLLSMRRRRIPVALVNARLSDRSLRGYLRCRSFFASVFSCFDRILVQSSMDAERFRMLGLSPDLIHVAGNLKFDQNENMEPAFGVADLRQGPGIRKETPVVVAGSTHEGEEVILFRIYRDLRKKYPDLLMIVAPRDPGRCPDLLRLCESDDIPAVLLSSVKKGEAGRGCVLVDEMGILSCLYGLSDVAFIGGSLVRQGGHNPLEAASAARPILFGPDMSDFPAISRSLVENKGSVQVDSEGDLRRELDVILGDEASRHRMGLANLSVFKRHSGAVDRILAHLKERRIV